MRDIKGGVLLVVPAAITILGIIWFLRRKTTKDGEGNKNRKKKEDTSSVVKQSKEEVESQILSHSDSVKEEGITLTQRKIPEKATVETLKTRWDKENSECLSVNEEQKAKEIVEAAIGAGLQKVRAECLKKRSTDENSLTPVVEKMAVKEEVMVQSSALLNQCSNAKNEANYLNNLNNNSNVVEQMSCSHALVGDTLRNVEDSNNPLAPTPSDHPTKPDRSENIPALQALSSSSWADTSAHSLDSSVNVPSNSNPSLQPCNEAVISSCTYSSNNSSVLPSDNTLKDNFVRGNNVIHTSSSTFGATGVDTSPIDEESQSCLSEISTNVTTSQSDCEAISDVMMSSEHADQKVEESSAISSSPNCDNNSVGSNDSGRGGSEQDPSQGTTDSQLVHYDFNMPADLCGKLIGRQGKNVKLIKSKSGANVSLTNNPATNQFQICQVVGTQQEVDAALTLIRRRFPLEENPHLSMTPIAISIPKAPDTASAVTVSDNMQLGLPDGASVEVYVSTIVDAGLVFVQQPTHRSFMSLEKLNFCLQTVYSQENAVPPVPTPVECGVICVCENEGSWYRTMIMTPETEFGECQVKFVDYGGYAQVPISSLKQIRADFMNLPFQAVECFMANIAPLPGEELFSMASTMALSQMSQMKLLQCQVVARNEQGFPYIHLYALDPASNTATLLNKALVNEGLVRWVEIV